MPDYIDPKAIDAFAQPEAERPSRDDWKKRLVVLAESSIWLGGPLHRGAGALALPQAKIIPHSDLVPIADDWRPREGEDQAVGKFDAPPDVPLWP
jgi:hypothetical protein